MSSSAQSEVAVSSDSTAAVELAVLLQGAGLSNQSDTGWIRVTGEDRVRWLNGMVTNSIQQLKPGEGTYNFLLSVQGRIQGDATIFARSDDLLLKTSSAQVPVLMALLDRFIIMDDVELTDISGTWSDLMIAGPQAALLLQVVGLPVADLEPLALRTIVWNDNEIHVHLAHSPVASRYELSADTRTTAKLTDALQAAGAVVCGEQSLEWLRILEGTPQFGRDIRDRELPQETGQTRALHFAKGCYLGQEIVERIRSRGNVHRTFSGFRLEGELPVAGALLEAEGKQVGELTSVAAIPLPGEGTAQYFALGYVRREALDRGLAIVYPGGTAVPGPLPFSPPAASSAQAASDL